MIFLRLALKSLRNRSFSSVLTVISIALSVSLLFSVDRIKRATEDGFTQAISRTDLIVGARGGSLQLLLYTVFNIGNATHNISYDSYEKIKQDPAIDWTIPYSLGDSHRGYRVIGTNEDFFAHYHYRGGQTLTFSKGGPFSDPSSVVLGSEVARKLGYRLGQPVVITHGVTKGQGFQHHDDFPFRVSGVLQRTGTALDRSLYISLEGMEAIHEQEKSISHDQSHDHFPTDAITAFFVGAKSRSETLALQRSINTYADEPLMAVIPGVALAELWSGLAYIEGGLQAISWMVILVGFMGMLIALTATLNERRREMAILRALGATSLHISGLLIFESALLTAAGVLSGILLSAIGSILLKPWLESAFGLYLTGIFFSGTMFLYVLATLIGGVLIGVIPALRARRVALKDGLSVRQ